MAWNLSETHLWLKGLTPAMKSELFFILQWYGALRAPFLSSGLVPPAQPLSVLCTVFAPLPGHCCCHRTCPMSTCGTRHDVTELWYRCKLRMCISDHLGALAHFALSLITEDSRVSWWEGWGRNQRKCDFWWGRKSWVPALVSWGNTPPLGAILAGKHVSKCCSRTQDWVKPFGVGKSGIFLGVVLCWPKAEVCAWAGRRSLIIAIYSFKRLWSEEAWTGTQWRVTEPSRASGVGLREWRPCPRQWGFCSGSFPCQSLRSPCRCQRAPPLLPPLSRVPLSLSLPAGGILTWLHPLPFLAIIFFRDNPWCFPDPPSFPLLLPLSPSLPPADLLLCTAAARRILNRPIIAQQLLLEV